MSKGRLYGAQFCGWLDNNHWLDLAKHANQQAAKLAAGIEAAPTTRLVWPTMANEVFAILPNKTIAALRASGAVLYEWIPSFLPQDLDLAQDESVVRLVCSFRTQDEEVDQFIAHLDGSSD